MRSSPDPAGPKPPRGRLFRSADSNRRDEIPQRHERTVHIEYIAIPVVPIVMISSPTPTGLTDWVLSAGTAALALLGRLAWNYVTPGPRTA